MMCVKYLAQDKSQKLVASLRDLGIENDFLGVIPKAHQTKEKLDMNWAKCHVILFQRTPARSDDSPENERNQISDKGLLSRTYKSSHNKKQTIPLKTGEFSEKDIFPKKIHTEPISRQRSSTALVTWEMPIKTTVRYLLLSTRMVRVKSKQTDVNACW